ncbi:hypothetical protein [Alicyclobacillus sp. ALC3]|uniref:hypothetical protein n=1 Tax=Alicyclobacillus sp. ALC3 TaxID=2796143 RepID=UPI0023787C1E|nr:hypothetical protein [Alicyclobacillus sp. ALC3]WDL96276.1 hypothetical protein JC200_18365 [Alicyclobacillus sp. ALC3]
MSTTEKDLQDTVVAGEQVSEQTATSAETAETEEEMQTRRLKIEESVQRYFQNKEISRERSEENKLLFEELEVLFQQSGEEEIVIVLPNGEHAVLTPKISEREVLDRDLLADEMQVPKDELKTPFDFCMFTAQGKLTPDMITKHTTVEREIKMKITKRKATSRRRRGRQSADPVEE